MTALAVGLTLAAATAGAGLASAEPGGDPPTTPSASSSVIGEDAVEDVAGQVTQFWQEPGYGKVQVDYANARVNVLWKGHVPPAVAELEGDNGGVEVVIEASKYSEAELTAAAGQVVDSQSKAYGIGAVAAVLPNGDRSGLIVEIPSPDAKSPSAPTEASTYEALVGYPVEVKIVRETPVPATRQNDSAPWQGGGALAEADGDDYCSVGFAVVLNNGQGRLLSAAHCPHSNVGNSKRDGVGDLIGEVSARNDANDSVLIDPNASPATIGKVFGGPWDAGTGHARYQFSVNGSLAPAVDMVVCSSGARSGEHCNRTIQATGVAFNCGRANSCSGFRARGPGVSVAGGDSGGPIYHKRGDGKVGARGIISAAGDTTTCSSVAEATTCYRDVYAIGIHRLLNLWDADIETG